VNFCAPQFSAQLDNWKTNYGPFNPIWTTFVALGPEPLANPNENGYIHSAHMPGGSILKFLLSSIKFVGSVEFERNKIACILYRNMDCINQMEKKSESSVTVQFDEYYVDLLSN